MADVHTLIIRSRAIRARADKTDTLEFEKPLEHASAMTRERADALKLLQEMEGMCSTTWSKYQWLEQQVFDLLGTLTRDSTGLPWKRDLPDKQGASDFYQRAVALCRFMKAERQQR